MTGVSHRDEARELERIQTWLADHDALDGAVADSAIELFEALARSIREGLEAYARAVSDVVEEQRALLNRYFPGSQVAKGIKLAIDEAEKWAADRKADTR